MTSRGAKIFLLSPRPLIPSSLTAPDSSHLVSSPSGMSSSDWYRASSTAYGSHEIPSIFISVLLLMHCHLLEYVSIFHKWLHQTSIHLCWNWQLACSCICMNTYYNVYMQKYHQFLLLPALASWGEYRPGRRFTGWVSTLTPPPSLALRHLKLERSSQIETGSQEIDITMVLLGNNGLD